MKKLIIAIILILGACIVCNAQFHYGYYPYYTPDDYARANIQAQEDYQLNNIRFDEYALKQNPEAWANYQKYLEIQKQYDKKDKTYSTVAWAGLGVCVLGGLITTATFAESGSYIGPGLAIAGSAVFFTGTCGLILNRGKMKGNKKEFIYYLKTANNGIGIVTLF